MTTSAVSYTKNTPPNIWEQATEYLSSRDGVYRTQRLASDTLSLVSESATLAGHSLPRWSDAATVLNTGALGVIIPFAVGSTIDAGQDALKYAKRGKALSWGEGVDFIQKAAVSAEMIAYSAALFTKRSVCNLAGDVFAAVEDGLDIVLERDAFHAFQEAVQPTPLQSTSTQAAPVLESPNCCPTRVKESLEAGKPFVCGTPLAMELSRAEAKLQEAEKSSIAKVYFDEFKKLHYLKLAKAVTAFAVGIFGLLGLFYGAPVIPSILLLAMSVVSSSLSIFNRWYKQNMTYNLEA
jgi:hypothetical protein